jgi:peroxiredoxin
MNFKNSPISAKGAFSRLKQAISLACVSILFNGPTVANAAGWQPAEGQELIGTKAPEFKDLQWIGSAPLELRSLRGKVVLIRFWLSGCPLCENSAAALNYLDEKYRDRGLVVIGIHHPKSEETKKLTVVQSSAKQWGFKFPIAQDEDWSTINSFWLGKTKRRYTSATFLIDKSGRICWLHDGGTLRMTGPDSAAFLSLEEKIASALASTK